MRFRPRLLDALLLTLIIVAGLVIRLVLAPAPGYEFDVGVNQGWGRSAVELGLARSYTEQVNGNMLPNYAPFSLILFMSAAFVQQQLFGGFDGDPLAFRILIKMPAILADLGTAVLFFFLLRKWKGRAAGLLGALVYTFHPAVIHDSAFWGQTDSIYTLFLVAAVGMFSRKNMILAGACIALASLTKMQAVALYPLFLVLFCINGWRAFLDGLLGGLLVAVPILAPFGFGGTMQSVIDVYLRSVGYYSIASSAAYNFWWSLFADAAGSLPDTTTFFGIITYRQFGFLLFGLSAFYAIAVLWRFLKPSPRDLRTLPALSLAAGFMAFTFFLWNTQMHERYLFPFVALGLPFAFVRARSALLYALISLLFYLNILGWLSFSFVDKWLFTTFPAFDVLIASGMLLVFFPFAHELWVYRSTAPEPSATRHPPRSPRFWRRFFRHATA